ncbi:hypothetical protein GCM10023113_24910 [Cellulomonas oligotrophica]|uniref:Uncharacterized protein n=1 Tax=Cellulomonas oligotrophica TaxID=931536 RepID=A0ABQ4DE45_9CELL|nr:hypothetical protein Col01nite_31530 [Cellulomonas oligotrophica]
MVAEPAPSEQAATVKATPKAVTVAVRRRRARFMSSPEVEVPCRGQVLRGRRWMLGRSTPRTTCWGGRRTPHDKGRPPSAQAQSLFHQGLMKPVTSP